MTPNSKNSSYQDDVLTIEKRIAVVESEIARLQAQVVEMKRTRNSLTPLCRLPSEILGQILLRTQAPDWRRFIRGYDPLLYDFEHNPKWEKVALTCSHIRDSCITTPLLWTHIDLLWPVDKISTYMKRSGVVKSTLRWDPADYIMTRYPESRKQITVDVSLARACFNKACAAEILLRDVAYHHSTVIMQVVQESAQNLTTLHVDLCNGNYWTWLHPLKIYPALVELSIMRGSIRGPITVHLPLLSRLHLNGITLDNGILPLIMLLRQTPLLTEVLLCQVESDANYESIVSLSEQSLTLPVLCRMVLIGCPFLILGLLTMLSPLPLLRELVINADFEDIDPLEEPISSSLFQRVMMFWSQISGSSLPHTKLVWTPGSSEKSWLLDIRTPRNVTPAFTLRTIYCDDEMFAYQQYGLEFKTIRVSQLNSDQTSPPWTTMLSERVHLCARGLKELVLEFSECNRGLPGIEEWIRTQHSEGRRIQRVSFTRISPRAKATRSDYELLKNSGLVQEVDWEEAEVEPRIERPRIKMARFE
jgi:hypothetical protein